MLTENINILIFIVEQILLLMWYGFVISWIISVYYKTLRSRVMLFIYMLWKINISFCCNNILISYSNMFFWYFEILFKNLNK